MYPLVGQAVSILVRYVIQLPLLLARDSELSSAYTLSDVRTRAYAFVARLLRDGPVRDVLAGLRREADTFENFNVLRFFYDLDSRFFAVSDDDREEAYGTYCALLGVGPRFGLLRELERDGRAGA